MVDDGRSRKRPIPEMLSTEMSTERESERVFTQFWPFFQTSIRHTIVTSPNNLGFKQCDWTTDLTS